MNPFLKEFKLKLIQLGTINYVIDTKKMPNDGIITETADVTALVRNRHIEQQKKTSLYYQSYWKGLLSELSDTACRLFLYIAFKLDKNEDFINLKLINLQRDLKLSKPTLIKAIKCLEDNAILRNKAQSEYWINPAMLFHGDRIAYYKDQCPECIDVVANIKQK